MPDDEVDEELLELLRQSMGLKASTNAPPETGVLKDAEYINDNAIDVAIDSASTKAAASMILEKMQEKQYSPKTWSTHTLHPKGKTEDTVNFIFTMDLLNFSFWPESPASESFTVEFDERRWTGYWSLVAALNRALQEGIPVTDPCTWQDEEVLSDDVLTHIFRSSTPTPIPLLEERIRFFREAGRVLYEKFDCSIINCIKQANGSAAALVNLLVNNFRPFRDEAAFDGKTVRFYKRAQIFVADIWACFEGEGYGKFDDIDKITMFADYRVPQILRVFGCIQYSPSLEHRIKSLESIPPGHRWEIQLRGCSIWCVELIRRQILRLAPSAKVNAILIDFFLYDYVKEKEAEGLEMFPHHRTRTVWY